MLKKFEVTGYKNFGKKFTLDFSKVRDYHFNEEVIQNGLVNTAIIYGQNAVGKTNFGKAIMDIRSNILNDSLMQSVEDYLNADMDEKSAEFLYEFRFGDNDVSYRYRKNSEFSLEYEALFINDSLIFEYDHLKNKMIKDELKKIHADTLNWEFVEEVPSIFSYIANNVSLPSDSPIKQLFHFIRGMRLIRGNLLSGKSILVNRLIKEIVTKNLTDDFEQFLNRFNIREKLVVLNVGGENQTLYFNHKRPINFFNNASSGTLSLLQIYSWYRNLENVSFLYLDEFDAFYHHELSVKMIEMFKEITNCQLVTTSHNTDLLTNKIMRPDSLFIMTENRITSLPEATNRELREGHNLEKLYKSGEFDE